MAVIVSERRSRIQASPLRHVDLVLFGAPIVLSAIGLLMVYSSTHRKLEEAGLDPYDYVKRQGLAIAAGVVVMLVLTSIDYRRLRELALLGFLGTVLLLVAVLKFGANVKGAQARFDVGPFQIQPAELAKLFLTLLIAGYCVRNREALSGRRLIAALLIAGVPLGLIMLQPDLGTALVLMAMVFTIVMIAGARARHLVVLFLLGLTFAVGAVQAGVLDQYQIDRLTNFADSGANLKTSGLNQEQSQIAIATGGVTGQGLFEGSQTRGSFVPEQHTDFIFTVVGEELGFVGGAFVLLLFAVIILRILRAARLAHDPFGALCCMGILAMFVVQVFENVGMTMGIMPITGIPLPFMSYGGSSIVVSFACIGLVSNVQMRRFS